MRPSHRLDIFAVPEDPAWAPVDRMRRLLEELVEQQVIDDRGRPGPQAAAWMPEGFAGLRLDTPGRVALYANRQGGFRVDCPVTGELITPAFAEAWQRARGIDRPDQHALVCPSCGHTHTLAETVGRPSFRFASLALQTIDAETLVPAPAAIERLTAVLGPVAWVGVRT